MTLEEFTPIKERIFSFLTQHAQCQKEQESINNITTDLNNMEITADDFSLFFEELLIKRIELYKAKDVGQRSDFADALRVAQHYLWNNLMSSSIKPELEDKKEGAYRTYLRFKLDKVLNKNKDVFKEKVILAAALDNEMLLSAHQNLDIPELVYSASKIIEDLIAQIEAPPTASAQPSFFGGSRSSTKKIETTLAPEFSPEERENLRITIIEFLDEQRLASKSVNTQKEQTQDQRVEFITCINACFTALQEKENQMLGAWIAFFTYLTECRMTAYEKKIKSTFGDALHAVHNFLLIKVEKLYANCTGKNDFSAAKDNALCNYTAIINSQKETSAKSILQARIGAAALGHHDVFASTKLSKNDDIIFVANDGSKKRKQKDTGFFANKVSTPSYPTALYQGSGERVTIGIKELEEKFAEKMALIGQAKLA